MEKPKTQNEQVNPNPNNTGLPENLKSGIEALSGFSMDNVKVHYDSPKPAQLNALAYAQGTEIHLGPGQEQHLPHEAWHVVQQTKGLVKPTMQINDRVGINDDAGLEQEADVMGSSALALAPQRRETTNKVTVIENRPEAVVQRELVNVVNHGTRVISQHTSVRNVLSNPQAAAQRSQFEELFGDAIQLHINPANASDGHGNTLQNRTEHPDKQVIQCFPYKRVNSKTKRAFIISHQGNEISATQVEGDMDDTHSASLIYAVRNFNGRTVFELSHILSDPEIGSGLGSLLVFYMSKIAESMRFTSIEIPTAASTAVGFYELMGWQSVDPKSTAEKAEQYFESNSQNKWILDKYFDDSARVAYDSNPENHAMKRRGGFFSDKTQLKWKDLGEKEKHVLIEIEEKKFNELKIEDHLKKLKLLNYNKAVANTGMIGDTKKIKGKSYSNTLNIWTDETASTWEKAWDSRFTTKHLTEFPRYPDE